MDRHDPNDGGSTGADSAALSSRISTLERWEPAAATDAAWSGVLARVRRRRRIRRAGVGIAAACVVLLGVLFARTPTDTAQVVSDPDRDALQSEELSRVPGEVIGEPVDVSVLSVPGSHELGPWPLSQRDHPAIAWTGNAMFVWGGVQQDTVFFQNPTVVFDDGAVFDTAAGRWVQVAAAPFDSSLYEPTAVWDGTEVIVVGLGCSLPFGGIEGSSARVYPNPAEDCPTGPVAAAWDPSDNTWRTLPAPPFAPLEWPVGTDGAATFIVPHPHGGGESDSPVGQVVRWDSANGTWSQRSDGSALDPGEGDSTTVTCTGTAGARLVSAAPAVDDPEAISLRSFDADSGRWGEPIALGYRLERPVACNGEVVVLEVGVTADDQRWAEPPPGVPASVYDLLQNSDLISVDLDSGAVARIDDGSTFGGASAIGDWVVLDKVDETTLADRLAPGSTGGSGDPTAPEVPTAPTPDTYAVLVELPRSASEEARTLDLVPAASDDWIPTSVGGAEGVWTGALWLGEVRRVVEGGTNELRRDPTLVAWVPPPGP